VKRPEVVFTGSAVDPKQYPKDGLPEVAFLGRSNVGKSSLLNALAGSKKLARVSSTPGRTQLVNFFRVGNEMYLADLPGYGYAKVPERERLKWQKLAETYLGGRVPLALCVVLVDSRHAAMESDAMMMEFLDHLGLPYVVVASKSDKLGRGELKKNIAALERGIANGAREVLPVSAQDGMGLERLWGVIRETAREHRERSQDAGHR
jgi:GTP-binding protein